MTVFRAKSKEEIIEGVEYENICSMIASELSSYLECALIIILLKKINDSSDFYGKVQGGESIAHFRKEYNQNVLFINDLLNKCYGSVFEQIEQMEQMMPYYVNSKIGASDGEAINTILADDEQQRKEKANSLIMLAGLIISMVFGLPAIYESLSILREMLRNVVEHDIPIVTSHNVSVVIWMILIITIIIKLYKMNPLRTNKRKETKG